MLIRRWERARQGDGQLALIVGEPGLGKSRLIEEFHSRLRDTPHTWVEWTCSQLSQSTPLHPIAEWGRQQFGGADLPAERRLSDLENTLALIKLDPAENVPLLAPLLDIPLPPELRPVLAPDELRRRQLAALTNWVMAGARAQPIVLTLEDLHWADPTTLDVLRGIAERGALAPLFLLLTARPEFRPSWGARSHHGVISLVPLDRAQVRHMMEELAARQALGQEVIEGVTERTGGVPLFVEEVTRLLLERGEQRGIQPIPPTLQQSLTARLDRLGPAREVAQIAAVIGRSFSYPLVRAVANMEDEALQAALERLAEADILLVQGLPPESEYRFKHALIQDAAYENLLRSRRQALHRRTGEVLRDQFAATTAAAEPELLAHHFTQAGLTEAAIEWWGTAGQRSLARSALVEAAEQLKRALAHIATLPATPALRREEIKLAVAFANVLALTGDFAEGKEHYDRALAICDPAEHRSLTTRSGRDLAVTLLSFRSNCVWLLGIPLLRSMTPVLRQECARNRHVAALVYTLSRAARSYTFCGNYATAHAQLDELMALADERGKAVGTVARGRVFALTGKASDAVRRSPRESPHFGQLEQVSTNRQIFGIWRWLTRNFARLTMLGIALTTR